MAESEAVHVSTDDSDSSRIDGSGERPSVDDEEGDDDDDDEEFHEGSGSGDRELITTNNSNNLDKVPEKENDDIFFNSNINRTITTTTTESSSLPSDTGSSNTKPSSATINLPFFGIVFLTLLFAFCSSFSFLL